MLKAQRTLKANLRRREELEREARENRPHVILGHKPGDEARWTNCDLARILVSEADMRASPVPEFNAETGELLLPALFNYGIGEKEKGMLFEKLPQMTTQGRTHTSGLYAVRDPRELVKQVEQTEREEMHKGAMLARLVDLRNANAQGIAYENRRRIVAAFSGPDNQTDTGRPEVQGAWSCVCVFDVYRCPLVLSRIAAIATMRIRNMWEHLTRCKRDVACRRDLRRMVHKRAKILKYLKRVDEDRYDAVLERLGLERGAVEGELIV